MSEKPQPHKEYQMATNDRGKSAILTLSMPPETVEALDAAAKAAGENRSAYIRMLHETHAPMLAEIATLRQQVEHLEGVTDGYRQGLVDIATADAGHFQKHAQQVLDTVGRKDK
jgi:predicted DNA-binding protein